MPTSFHQRVLIGLTLATAMAATRSHHFADLNHLPDASWAVFFLAGFYLLRGWTFTGLLGVAALSDVVAISWGGVSDFCVSPAYGFLLPAYGALFMAGRWFAARYRFAPPAIVTFVAAAFTGTLVSELLSSGGFYFFSGRFVAPTFAEFGERLMHYFPGQLEGVAVYLGVAAIVHIGFTLASEHKAFRGAQRP